MSPRLRLEEMLANKKVGRPLIDIGTNSLTGLRKSALPHLFENNMLTNPIFQTISLEQEDCKRLGSDFIRSGMIYDPQTIRGGCFTDAFGVEWLNSDGIFTPSRHPLESSSLNDVEGYLKPEWWLPAHQVKQALSSDNLVIADAPCPGLLDCCFLLRGTWRFLDDITEKRSIAAALLEWSLETIISAYEYMLRSFERQPDVIIYNDDLCFQNSMFFSLSDFRSYLVPKMRTLLTRLRKLTPAAICFHSCGAISPILPDIANLEVEMLNLDPYAQGMDIRGLRQKLPAALILHGVNDLCALGEVLIKQDKAGIAYFITELAQSAPVIAAPVDSLSGADEVIAAARGAAFIKSFSDEDFMSIRRLGPVRSIIEKAIEKTLSEELPFI